MSMSLPCHSSRKSLVISTRMTKMTGKFRLFSILSFQVLLLTYILGILSLLTLGFHLLCSFNIVCARRICLVPWDASVFQACVYEKVPFCKLKNCFQVGDVSLTIPQAIRSPVSWRSPELRALETLDRNGLCKKVYTLQKRIRKYLLLSMMSCKLGSNIFSRDPSKLSSSIAGSNWYSRLGAESSQFQYEILCACSVPGHHPVQDS